MNAAKLSRIRVITGALALLLFSVSMFGQTSHEAAFKNLKFRSIGPAVMGGRIDDFAVVESDPRIIYVGTAAGGIFKTVNGGVTWTPIFDEQPNPSIGDLALAPSNPSILYAGTGEPNNRQSSSWGAGVFKSMDAGKTWQALGLKETHHIGRIAVHPSDPNTAFVAALGDLWGPNKERGVYKTTDGGATWTLALFINDDTGVSDVAIDPQSPNIVYAAAYERRRTAFGFNGGGPAGGIYRTIDGGAHWAKLTQGLPSEGDIGRCAIDIFRKNPNIVYVLVQHATGGGIYRSDDKGATFSKMSGTNPRPSYYSQVRVDPNNENKVWVLGAPLYMSEDGGKTFTTARGAGIHSDFHGFWIDPANGDHVLAGSDGGLTISWDSGRSWDFVNNFPIGQFYEVTYDFEQPYHVCGGLQDNNTWCGPTASLVSRGVGNFDWIQISGGDGFHARIDPKDANTVYAESQDGNLSRRDLASSVGKSIRPQEDDDKAPRYRFQWNSPLIVSAHDNHTLYYGGNYLFKSTDRGDTWERLGNKDLTTGQERDKLPILGKTPDRKTTLSLHDGVVSWPCITAIAESPVKAGVLWAGTDDGNVQVSRDGGKTWSNVVAKIPGAPKGGYVSRIEASYKEEGAAYLAFDNHRSQDYGVYLYMTKNFGDSWTKISSGIPPEAGTVHVVREDPANPNLLFSGTEFGLFVSFNRGQNWERLKNGLPTVPVFDLQIHPRDHDLIVATHGRSLYIMDNILPLEQMEDTVLSTDLKVFDSLPGTEWRVANYKVFTGGKEFVAPNPQQGVLLQYYTKAAGPVQIAVTDKAGNRVHAAAARAEAGVVNRTLWNMRSDPPLATSAGGAAGGGGRGAAGGGGRAGGAPGGGGRGAIAATAGAAGTAAGEAGAEAQAEPGAAGGRGGGGFPGGRGGGGGFVEPGDYTVAITAGGKTETKTVTVADDPRIVFSAEDRTKQKQAVDRLVSMTKEADTGRRKIAAIRTALTDLMDSWKRPGAPAVPETVKSLADEILARVKSAERCSRSLASSTSRSSIFPSSGGTRCTRAHR